MQCLKRDILRSPLASEFREEKVGEERNRGGKEDIQKATGRRDTGDQSPSMV